MKMYLKIIAIVAWPDRYINTLHVSVDNCFISHHWLRVGYTFGAIV